MTIFIGVQIDGDLEKAFLAEEQEKHQPRATLLRAILAQHFEVEANPILYLVKQPSFQKLLGLVVKANAQIEAEKAKQETLRLKEEQRQQAAKDRALSGQAGKVDWGNSEGFPTVDDEGNYADGFSLGDR